MATRNYWDHPGGANSAWNTPIGDGATHLSASDPETVSARTGGFINSTNNYGAAVWVSRSSSDPTFTFSGTDQNYMVAAYPGSGTPIGVTAHVQAGAYSPGPYPGDNQFLFIDDVSHPGKFYHFGGLNIQNLQAGQGPFTNVSAAMEDCFSDSFGEDAENGTAGHQGCGIIRAYDLDGSKNLARFTTSGGKSLVAIQHVMRYSHDAGVFKGNAQSTGANASAYPNGLLNANAWPQLYQDYQSGINVYTGNLLYGRTLYIPMTETKPSGLTDAGEQIWWTLQRYGSYPRDQAGGGYHLTVDQVVPQSWIDQANQDMPTITQHLYVMNNQHQAGEDFSTHPKNGPGTRLDSGPPAIAQTAPTISVSANKTVVSAGTTATITDYQGNVWSITGNNKVAMNGFEDGNTANVSQLAYVSSRIYHKNTSNQWYYKTNMNDAWTGPTTTSPLTVAESADKTVVFSGSSSAIIDSNGNSWTITSGGQVAVNGVTDTTTSNVVELAYVSKKVWQENSSGYWYGKSSPSDTWSPTLGTTTSPLSTTSSTGSPKGGVTNFPYCNFIRLNCYNYDTPSHYASFIQAMTGNKIVVLLEHHAGAGGGQQQPLTGSNLQAENNWFIALANAYKDNPYVWYGTLNEPGDNAGGSGITTNQISNYNAIRGTGATNIIVFQTFSNYANGNYMPGAGNGLTSASYANCTNVIWDTHYYNDVIDFMHSGADKTSQSANNTAIAQVIAGTQTIKSADGTMPVIIGEYGPSTDDVTIDEGGTQACIAAQNCGFGSMAWNYNLLGSYDGLVVNGSLTSYGQQVANWMAQAYANTQ